MDLKKLVGQVGIFLEELAQLVGGFESAEGVRGVEWLSRF